MLFSYLNGQDLSSDPNFAPSRWVINFHDWPEERAKQYPACHEQVARSVRPEREKNSYSKNARQQWWLYERARPELYETIAPLRRVIAIALVSKTVMPAMVPTGQVFSHMLGIFATEDTAMLAALASSAHYWWAASRGSTLETRVRYTPTDVFETFPLPPLTDELRQLGEQLDRHRRHVMTTLQAGLTKTYNLVFDPYCVDPDIEELRRLHRAIDEATVRAYGWRDRIAAVGGLDHGFHPVGRETRYTIGPAAQREILDSLLELNHERYADEVARGLHAKARRKGRHAADQHQLDLRTNQDGD